jgi:DNA repair exonuclease SbcCD nuclease subunit
MKIALITDTHWGVRGDIIPFHDYFKKSVHEFFIPELKARGIERIIHLGDLVDRRKYINYMTAHRLRKDFLEPINAEFKMDVIPGNHDTYFKNTNSLNALSELISGKYQNIDIFTRPQTVTYDDVDILYVPWICDDNREETLDVIKNTTAQIAMGHLELTGFEMYRGHINDHGMDSDIFGRFDVVCSGHFHHKSMAGNITYIGAFTEHTWTDFDDPRGFTVFDTDTRSLEFVRNPFTVFKKIFYDDMSKTMDQVLLHDIETKGSIVKVIVKNKTNPYWFDLFIDAIENTAPIDLQVVEDHLNLDIEDDSDIIDEAESTLDIFKKYIEGYEMKNLNKEKLTKKIFELYNEALSLR